MHSVTSAIENGFVHIPVQAPWLGEYLHEIAIFPNGRFDDQVDSTSQALDWIKEHEHESAPIIEFMSVAVPHIPFPSRSHALERSARAEDGWIIISK